MTTATQMELKESTIDYINELVEDSYHDGDMYAFIDEYGEDVFVSHYEQYVQLGEEYCYEAVDAFLSAFDFECLDCFSDAYRGAYNSPVEFAEEFVNDVEGEIVPYIVVDWEATWNQSLKYDFVFEEGFVFDRNF